MEPRKGAAVTLPLSVLSFAGVPWGVLIAVIVVVFVYKVYEQRNKYRLKNKELDFDRRALEKTNPAQVPQVVAAIKGRTAAEDDGIDEEAAQQTGWRSWFRRR